MAGILCAVTVVLLYEWSVCLRGVRLGVLGSRSIECMDESSLLSDCTRGLVGCL